MSMFLYVPCFHLGELKLAPQMAECGLGRMAWPGALGQGTASLLTTLNLAQGLAQSKHPADTSQSPPLALSRFLMPGGSRSSPPLTILLLSPASLLAFVLFAEDAAGSVPAWKLPSLHLLQPHVPPSGPQWLLLTLSSELKHHHSE